MVFGGMVCVPRAVLRKEKTTISLKNEVITKMIVGASASIVKTIIIFKVVTSC